MKKTILVLSMFFISIIIISGCSSERNIKMINSSSEEAHIFRSTRGFSSNNKLQPGQSRTVEVDALDGPYEICAGRNGVIISCTSVEGSENETIIFDGTSLSIK